MSLLSLKKSKSSAKPKLHSVDSFIDDAITYAAGEGIHQQVTKIEDAQHPVRRGHNDARKKACLKAVKCNSDNKQQKGMRHATFTLTPECITQLSLLSQDSGVARSAIIREWISAEFEKRLQADALEEKSGRSQACCKGK